MRDHWRAEEEARDRSLHRFRGSERGDRRPRSPPPSRREEKGYRYRSPPPRTSESYRLSSGRELARESKHSRIREASLSPRPPSKPKQGHKSRPIEERISRPRDASPTKSSKRKRSRSPSPARSGRYLPGRHRESRSRDRAELRDRRPVGIERTFGSRRPSPSRDPRSDRWLDAHPSDSYVPSHRRRARSRSPARRADGWSTSPRPRSRSPAARNDKPRKPKNPSRELSPYSARVLKTQSLLSDIPKPVESRITEKHRPKKLTIDETGHQQAEDMQNYNQGGHGSMGGHPPMRGSFQQNMMHPNRPPRPMVDTRSFQGSPPFGTPTSSYQGSSQPGSPFHSNRGGWGSQQFQGHG